MIVAATERGRMRPLATGVLALGLLLHPLEACVVVRKLVQVRERYLPGDVGLIVSDGGRGCRGISAQWAAEQVPVARLVVCHLGGGSSVTAVRDGRSVDTTMGLTPLEGLPMARAPALAAATTD